MRLSLVVIFLLALGLTAGCTPPSLLPASTHFYALNLPATTPPADRDGAPVAGVYRSVRLLLDDQPLAHSHTLVGEMDQGERLQPGHELGMAFVAPESFVGVAVSLSRVGPGPTNAYLTLKRSNAQGEVVSAFELVDLPQQGWAELRTGSQQAGAYYLELSDASGQGIYWEGTDLGAGQEPWQAYDERGVPFRLPATLAEIPSYDGASLTIPVGTQVERIYVLSGRSSYDYGIARWGDYEVRDDASDRQFIGDQVGALEVTYSDGSVDSVPVICGFNQWWWKRWGDASSGGPFPDPFPANPRPMIDSLQVFMLGDVPLAPSYWVFRPQAKPIASLRLVDNPQIQGFPLVSAITLEAKRGSGNATVLPQPKPDKQVTDWLAEHTITPQIIASGSYKPALQKLIDTLYTNRASIPTTVVADPVPGRKGPSIRFSGPPAAGILSNVYEHSLSDLLLKVDPNGAFHSSTAHAPNFGIYGGIGTWRNDVGYFYNQAWSRDMGRTLLEMIRLGFLDEAEKTLRSITARLYDLPNGYPTINRNGEKVPAHWETILGRPNAVDIDGMGDDDQANDGHGLLLLAFVRLWNERGRPTAWLDSLWPVMRDAAEWYCFQLESPGFSRATSVLYSEGEAANGGGYDIYSNDIAVEALHGAADMARSRQDEASAQRWDGCAATISGGMEQQLTMDDAQYGQTWKPVAWDWGYGDETLAPAFMLADLAGYTLSSSGSVTITQQTYDRQINLPSGFHSGRVIGYGQSFLTQAALMLDDMAGASQALDWLASFIYDADMNPYIVPEGIALHPSGDYWYRTGDLGNAMQEGEVLKTLALIAGLDDLTGTQLQIVPRLPTQWTGISVTDYPVTVDGQRLSVSYDLSRQASELRMDIRANAAVPSLAVRLGPLPNGVTARVTVDGVSASAESVESGGTQWVWLRGLDGRQSVQIDVEW